jgi:hypothetical protein
LNQARSVQTQTVRGFGLPEGMMDLSDELHRHIRLYLDGASDADALFGWLASVAPEASGAPEDAVRELWGTAFLLLSELSAGDVREDEVQRELADVSERQPSALA